MKGKGESDHRSIKVDGLGSTISEEGVVDEHASGVNLCLCRRLLHLGNL